MAEGKGTSVAELALGWLLHQPAVTSVIVGANQIMQLQSNLKAIDVRFTLEELQQLNAVSRLASEYPGGS